MITDAAGIAASPLTYPVDLYPEIEPFTTGLLDVGSGHSIYYEQSGKEDGIPALFLHGGPGGGCNPRSRRFFDPAVYRIVCLDQRGCGRSKPNAADDWEAALVDNNTAALVADVEKLTSLEPPARACDRVEHSREFTFGIVVTTVTGLR